MSMELVRHMPERTNDIIYYREYSNEALINFQLIYPSIYIHTRLFNLFFSRNLKYW